MDLLGTLKVTFATALIAASCAGTTLSAQTAAPAPAPWYNIKVLGVPAGVQSFAPTDLNELGEVTGWVRREGDLTSYGAGFVWRNGRTTLLEPPLPDVIAPGLAINNRGEVAGFAAGLTFAARPFVYRNGSLVDLRPEPVDRYVGSAQDINNAGWVTGQIGTPSGSYRTFVHDGAQLRFLDVEGESSHTGLAINDAGDVLIQSTSSGGISHYLYRNGQAMKLPEFGPGPSWSTFYRTMNNAGQVLGMLESSFDIGPKFIYNYLDGSVHFINAPDRSFSLSDINDQGWVVGNRSGRNGFLYRDGQMQSFDELLRPGIRDQWRDINLVGINNAGQILGTGVFVGPDGLSVQAFVANPVPEPGVAVLMLAGLGVVGWAARTRRNCSTQPS